MAGELALYKAEDRYLQLLEIEPQITPEFEEQFQLELQEALIYRDDKRESVAQFILALEDTQDRCDQEIKRIQAHKLTVSNVLHRLRRYVTTIIKNQGTDGKGKFKQLRGITTSMYVRALPASVDIIDDGLVPPEYKHADIRMPLDLWMRLCDQHPELTMYELMDIRLRNVTIDKEKIRTALENNTDIPGADLKLAGHDHTLIVK